MSQDRVNQWLETHALDRLISNNPHEKLLKIKSLVQHLNLNSNLPFVVTVAGTNGKGSTVACLESILTAAGLHVGSFTSPHLLEANERIKLNQRPVDAEVILNALESIEQELFSIYSSLHPQNALIRRSDRAQRNPTHSLKMSDLEDSSIRPAIKEKLPLSYFQMIFLAAMKIFCGASLDIIILEAGIGGQYDAVNAIDADLAIITSIALDHCHLLGETREAIGLDKAGIMRQGKPAIIGDGEPPATVLAYAKKNQVPLFNIQSDRCFKSDRGDLFCFDEVDVAPSSLMPQNIACALMAAQLLKSRYRISQSMISKGLKEIKLLGRRQIIARQNRSILLDVAHNPAAAFELAKYIKGLNVKGKVIAFFGIKEDKDVLAVIKAMMSVVDCWVVTDDFSNSAISRLKLTTNLNELGAVTIEGFSFAQLLHKTQKDDLIIAFGSFLIVSDVLKKIQTISLGGNNES